MDWVNYNFNVLIHLIQVRHMVYWGTLLCFLPCFIGGSGFIYAPVFFYSGAWAWELIYLELICMYRVIHIIQYSA